MGHESATRIPCCSRVVLGPFSAVRSGTEQSPTGKEAGSAWGASAGGCRAGTRGQGTDVVWQPTPRPIRTPKPLVGPSLSCSRFVLGDSQSLPPRKPGNQEDGGRERQPVTPSLWSRDGVTVPSGLCTPARLWPLRSSGCCYSRGEPRAGPGTVRPLRGVTREWPLVAASFTRRDPKGRRCVAC